MTESQYETYSRDTTRNQKRHEFSLAIGACRLVFEISRLDIEVLAYSLRPCLSHIRSIYGNRTLTIGQSLNLKMSNAYRSDN